VNSLLRMAVLDDEQFKCHQHITIVSLSTQIVQYLKLFKAPSVSHCLLLTMFFLPVVTSKDFTRSTNKVFHQLHPCIIHCQRDTLYIPNPIHHHSTINYISPLQPFSITLVTASQSHNPPSTLNHLASTPTGVPQCESVFERNSLWASC